jgi:asparagine synthase (glutamine-hydrolysing)
MCGINGVVRPGAPAGAVPLQVLIERMNDALTHRGPDGHGVFVDDARVGLGHRRLSILDLSDAGSQPMFNEDHSMALVFNGEIYNYLELIPELRAAGHVFRSHSDTEVILHAYEEWGPECVRRFNGMWAFALWDRRTRQLFVSRDRFGVKPFYFHHTPEAFSFSSEPAGLQAAGCLNGQANLTKLHAYLAYGYRISDGSTFFEGVQELQPGHSGLVDAQGGFRSWPHWALPERGARPAPPPAERAEAYRALLADAVRLRFRSDVPVALLQSGGLDSSAICATVNDAIEAGHLAQTEVTAFTAVYPGQPQDESAAVKDLMASCRHVRSVLLMPAGKSLGTGMEDFVRRMQEPVASSTSFVHQQLIAAIRQQGIKVVINGQGADEALAGYGRYIVGYRLLDLLQTRPAAAFAEARAMRRLMGFGFTQLAMQTAKALMGRRAASAYRARYVERASSVLDGHFHASQQARLPEVTMQRGGANLRHHLRSQLLSFGFNQILHYEDQSSMSESVEIRSPFIDYRLMELAFSLPDEALFSGGVTKRVLREAFATRLPASILHNHRKIGFATPFERWIREPSSRAMVEALVHSPEFRSRRIWNGDRLARTLLDPQAAARGFPVWRFLNAEMWMRQQGITNA